MDIEFIPKIRGYKDRLSTLNKIEFKIEESIKAKRRADLEAMSCLLYTSPSPRDRTRSRMPSSA